MKRTFFAITGYRNPYTAEVNSTYGGGFTVPVESDQICENETLTEDISSPGFWSAAESCFEKKNVQFDQLSVIQ